MPDIKTAYPCAGSDEYAYEAALLEADTYCGSCSAIKWSSEPEREFMGDGGWGY